MSFADGQLWQRILAHASAHPNQPAYLHPAASATLTYAQLVEQADAYSRSPDCTTLLRCENTIDFSPRFLGTLLAGRSVMPISFDVPAVEVTRLQERLSNMDASGASPSLLLSTSGTTAAPKIVRRTARSLDAVCAAMASAIGFTAADRVIAAVPLSHSYGLEHGLLTPLWAGSTVLLCGGLDLRHLTDALLAGATIFPAVPSVIELLTQLSGELSLRSLRRVYTAGAPLPPSVGEAFEARYALPIGQVYGSTEVGSVAYRAPHRDIDGCVGRAMQGVSIRILSNHARRRALDPGEDGEVAIRAESMLAGYLGDELELIDGHYPTGDIGHLSPRGELTLVGRVRLLIDVGGAKVNPLEVERVLRSHPNVADCVVLPLRLSATVNKIRAIVVPSAIDAPPPVSMLRDHVRGQLAAFKVPRVIEYRAALPRTPSGKIARQELEAMESRP